MKIKISDIKKLLPKNLLSKKMLTKKMIMPLALLLTTVMALICITYAWFLNIINVDGMDMHTGNFKYEFTGFYKDSEGTLREDFSVSTEDPDSDAIQKESLKATTQASTLISPLETGTG